MVVRDVSTRWNYTHAMIKHALLLRKAIDRWVHEHDELWALTLRADEWSLLEKLCGLLEVHNIRFFIFATSVLIQIPAIHESHPSDVQFPTTDLVLGTADVRIHDSPPQILCQPLIIATCGTSCCCTSRFKQVEQVLYKSERLSVQCFGDTYASLFLA